MTQPLALLVYEKLLPGSQLVNRLQDTGWRVQVQQDAAALVRTAEEHKPVILLADLHSTKASVIDQLAELRKNQGTSHIPVIAFSKDDSLSQPAVAAGATLVVSDSTVLQHLPQFLNQALDTF